MGNSEAKTKRNRLTQIVSLDENVEELQEFLANRGVNVNAKEQYTKKTAIMLAAEKGSPYCLKVLLNAGADVNTKDRSGRTALWHAASRGSQDCVNSLIVAGADVNTRDKYGKTPLMSAVSCSKGCVNALLAEGADVNKKDKYGRTALNDALCGGHKSSVDVLMDAGADVTMAGPKLSFLFNPALRIGHDRIVALLIDAGVDVNDWLENVDHNDGTNNPLICVAQKGAWSAELCFIKCAQVLLKAGICVNKKFMGHNALTWYCYQNSYPDEFFVRLLYAAGELVEWPELEDWAQGYVFVPEWLQGVEAVRSREECGSFKDLCRVSIRTHLLHLDYYSNLFIRVPKLGLPAPLTQYLLYGMSL